MGNSVSQQRNPKLHGTTNVKNGIHVESPRPAALIESVIAQFGRIESLSARRRSVGEYHAQVRSTRPASTGLSER